MLRTQAKNKTSQQNIQGKIQRVTGDKPLNVEKYDSYDPYESQKEDVEFSS